jgi:hypothetical protein
MPRLTLATSNLNFGYTDAVLRSPQWIAGKVEQAGFDGIEWSDTPNVHPLSLMHGGLARWLAKQGLITSMQQSWQSDRYRDIPVQFAERRTQDGVGPAVKSAIEQTAIITMLPQLETSLGKLQRVQRAAGRRLPVIVHPNEQHLGDKPRQHNVDYGAIRESGRFGPLRFQITAEYLAAIGVPLDQPEHTVGALYQAVAENQEFDEVVFDSHHATRRRGGFMLPDPPKVAGRLARDGKLAELQMCWRPDFSGDAAELRYALDGRIAETPQGTVLSEVNENLPDDCDLYVAIETPAHALGREYWNALGILATNVRQMLLRLQE